MPAMVLLNANNLSWDVQGLGGNSPGSLGEIRTYITGLWVPEEVIG